jgi:hypothetical protein
MFQLPHDVSTDMVEVFVQERPVRVPASATAAAAALLAGLTSTRASPVNGEPRAPYCMMGVCFECLLVIDGQSSRQGCMVQVRPGMRIERQTGARAL